MYQAQIIWYNVKKIIPDLLCSHHPNLPIHLCYSHKPSYKVSFPNHRWNLKLYLSHKYIRIYIWKYVYMYNQNSLMPLTSWYWGHKNIFEPNFFTCQLVFKIYVPHFMTKWIRILNIVAIIVCQQQIIIPHYIKWNTIYVHYVPWHQYLDVYQYALTQWHQADHQELVEIYLWYEFLLHIRVYIPGEQSI